MSNTEKAATTAELKSKIAPEVAELRDILLKDRKLDESNHVHLTPADYELSLISKGLTAEVAAQYKEHDVVYALAAGAVLAELALPTMAANKEVKRATLTAATVGKDTVNATFDRSRPKPGQKEGEPQQLSYGSLSIDLSFYGAKNGASLKHVKQAYSSAAASLLCD